MKSVNKFIIICFFCITGINVYAQCDRITIDNAQKDYSIGNFEKIISGLENCVENGFKTNNLKVEGLRLLAKSYIAIDSVEKAYESSDKLLKINPGFQADYTNDPPKFIQMIELLKSLGSNKVVTSVSKKSENVYKAPAKVIIITEEEIKSRGYTDLNQIFSDLPGFDISRPYGPALACLYQRGYRSDNTNRTLFLIDGVEDADLWSFSVFLSRQYPITNIKRIEVIYGPASTMYGANALVGVINIITKNPDEMTVKHNVAVSANVGYASYNTKYLDVTTAVKKKNMSVSINFRRYTSDERNLSKYPDYNFSPDDYDTVNYKKILSYPANAGKFVLANQSKPLFSQYYDVSYSPTGDTIAMLSDAGNLAARNFDKMGLMDTVGGQPISYTNNSEYWYYYIKVKFSDFTIGFQSWKKSQGINYFPDNRRPGAANGSYWMPLQSFFYAKYETDISDKFKFSNLTSVRWGKLDDNTRSTEMYNYSNKKLNALSLLSNKEPYFVTTYSYQNSRQFRNELKINYSPFPFFDLVSGVEFSNSFVQGDYRTTSQDTASVIEVGTSVGDTRPGGNYYPSIDIGAYAQINFSYRNWFQIVLGGRYDYDRIRIHGGYGEQFNPRLALIVTPGKFIFKAIYASAFQNASNFTKYATFPQRQLANPTLPPEEVKNYEFSAGMQLSENIYFDVIYYNSKYNGVTAIANVPYMGGTTQQNQAIGQLAIQGIQSDIYYKYENLLDVYMNFTYCDPKNKKIVNNILTDEYQRIGDISSYKFNLGATTYLFKKHLTLNLRMNYIGERITGLNTSVPYNPQRLFPAVTVLFGTVSLNDFPIKGLSLQLVCNNITNLEYFDPGIRSADGVSYAYRSPQRTRNYVVRLMYDF